MDKNENKKGSILVKILTVILSLFALLCIAIIIMRNNSILIKGTIGLVLLIITMNISSAIQISKDKVKIFSIISLLLSLCSIPFVFKQIIFAYALAVPGFILAQKAIKRDSRNIITKISFAITILTLIAYIGLSLTSLFIK